MVYNDFGAQPAGNHDEAWRRKATENLPLARSAAFSEESSTEQGLLSRSPFPFTSLTTPGHFKHREKNSAFSHYLYSVSLDSVYLLNKSIIIISIIFFKLNININIIIISL